MRIYKNAWFAKFALKERIDDSILYDAVERAEKGLIDADLGSGLLKQRVAQEGSGKSGGFRTLLFFRSGERAIFAFGFAKNDKANLSAEELSEFKKAARLILGFSQGEIDALVEMGRLTEITYDREDL
jgi:hypothetical protein